MLGEPGIWIFIGGDMLLFTMFFGSFLFDRIDEKSLFAASQASLNFGLGLTNTLLLLTSSLFVALSLNTLRRGQLRPAYVFLSLAIGCGSVFVIDKVIEYSLMIRSGISVVTNDFFMYYFMLTGIHCVHVLAGLVILSILLRQIKNSGNLRIDRYESGAVFWHMVDSLWIILFPLLYVVK